MRKTTREVDKHAMTALRAREVQSTERDSVKVTVQLVSKIKGQED